MATRYWVTFRLEENSGRDVRYNALRDTLSECTNGKWWDEPTSFILFESGLGIDDIAAGIANVIDVGCDVAVVGMPDYKGARVIGDVRDPDLFTLWPSCQRA